jgi:hypothetical protein
LANGVPAPNSSAAPMAAATPLLPRFFVFIILVGVYANIGR